MRVALVATYELGRQPFGLASPAAWLRRAGMDVACLDLSREPFDAGVAEAGLVAFHLPMHTATRLAIPVMERVRRLNPGARLCAYGLYAPLNGEFLRSIGVDHVLGGEFEADLVRLATEVSTGGAGFVPASGLPRLELMPPWRAGLPPLDRYATLQQGAVRKIAGYTEASRGCKHACRHCPVVPVYGGRFRVVSPDVVIADVAAQVEQGAEHVTFGDPDFFNGVGHAMRVVEGIARRFPGLTYDVTIKVEHLVAHADLLSRLRETGCLFVTSAVESFDDSILRRLEKGHTRDDVARAAALCRTAGLTLTPTFVAFTPWTTLDGYRRMLAEIEALDLVEQVAPIQLALRLLVTAGSGLLELEDLRGWIGPFDRELLVYPWRHPDPRVDRMADDVTALVGRRLTASRRDVFNAVLSCAHEGRVPPPAYSRAARRRAEVSYLNEPWYC
ncbi:MAG: radical SAM protein [Acidobacteria bacterium]|nr:radical SAM protein [Acidobacteriota bacterium]